MGTQTTAFLFSFIALLGWGLGNAFSLKTTAGGLDLQDFWYTAILRPCVSPHVRWRFSEMEACFPLTASFLVSVYLF